MLRRASLWAGLLLLAAGAIVCRVTASVAGVAPAVIGAVLLAALLVERRGYKAIQDRAPGPDWQKTGEQFVDPTSGVPVVVYFHPATGKRVYVRAGAGG